MGRLTVPAHLPPAPAQRGGAADLTRGIERNEIGVLYQPVVRLSDGHPVMVEALARWQPGREPIAPETFVPLAERSGLGRALSMAVAARALAGALPNPAPGATHWHALSVLPGWAVGRVPVAEAGGLALYRLFVGDPEFYANAIALLCETIATRLVRR